MSELIKRGDVSSPTSLESPSGAFVELMGPHPDDINLWDIAHNLSNECRFAGSCSVHYSVAEHVVLVAQELRRRQAHPVTVLRGLHHDDHEAYLKDLPRPLKRVLEIVAPDAYEQLAVTFDVSIFEALDLNPECGDGSRMNGSVAEVKEVDRWALGIEAVTMLPSKGESWIPRELIPAPDKLLDAHRLIEGIKCDRTWDAREKFLEEHERCMADAKAAVV